MSNAPVLVVGPFGRHSKTFRALAGEVPLLHLVPMPQLVDNPLLDWPHRAVLAVHRDQPVEQWATMARALDATHDIGLLWCIDDDHSEIALECANTLGVPVLGARTRPAAGAGARPDLAVRVLRRAGTLTLLSVTQLVHQPGTAHVLAELEIREGEPQLGTLPFRELVEPHVPEPFLGSVQLRTQGRTAEVLALRPWRAGDGTQELLRDRGLELDDLVAAATTRGPMVLRESSHDGSFRAIAAMGTEASGTLVSVDGIEAASATPGVREVVRLFKDGDPVRPLSATGDLLVRVTGEARDPSMALAHARQALTRLAPVVDVPPDFAGALDRVWF